MVFVRRVAISRGWRLLGSLLCDIRLQCFDFSKDSSVHDFEYKPFLGTSNPTFELRMNLQVRIKAGRIRMSLHLPVRYLSKIVVRSLHPKP